MTFGLSWNDQEVVPRHALDPDELLFEVRTAAENLVSDLQQAEKLTREWTEKKFSDMLIDAALSRCFARLAGTDCWGVANRGPSRELWDITGPLLDAGSLQHHARFKPHGYAGDHEMLTRICEETCCEDPLGSAFDRYFLSQAAPQAVRSRTRQTAAALVSHRIRSNREKYHVVSVGAGPAIDLGEALALLTQEHRSALHVILLDVDPYALKFARQRLEPLLPSGALRCIRENLFRLAQLADFEEKLGTPDFLVCPGLFDYLDDEPAISLLKLFWRQLGEDGLLLVGNFAPHNPTRAYMEWIGNWYLTYRTANQLGQLASRANIPPDQLTIGCESLGIDLFLIGRKR